MNDNRHEVFHKFEAFLEEKLGENYSDPQTLSGHEVIEMVEGYVKENPEIKIARCDDDMFAGSILVIVPHIDMGHTVIFIPQLTTITNTFFLYEGHRKSLLEALNYSESKSVSDKISFMTKAIMDAKTVMINSKDLLNHNFSRLESLAWDTALHQMDLAINGVFIHTGDKRVKELEAAMQEFVDRVEAGEVKSKKTYAKFKELLKK